MRFSIPRRQRDYISSHPLALWFSIGIIITTLVQLIAPDISPQTSVQILPFWLHQAFTVTYLLGGIFSFVGIVKGTAKAEAAGMHLLASGLFAQFIASAWVYHAAAVSGLFLVALAIGCASRARHLVRRGYQ